MYFLFNKSHNDNQHNLSTPIYKRGTLDTLFSLYNIFLKKVFRDEETEAARVKKHVHNDTGGKSQHWDSDPDCQAFFR